MPKRSHAEEIKSYLKDFYRNCEDITKGGKFTCPFSFKGIQLSIAVKIIDALQDEGFFFPELHTYNVNSSNELGKFLRYHPHLNVSFDKATIGKASYFRHLAEHAFYSIKNRKKK